MRPNKSTDLAEPVLALRRLGGVPPTQRVVGSSEPAAGLVFGAEYLGGAAQYLSRDPIFVRHRCFL